VAKKPGPVEPPIILTIGRDACEINDPFSTTPLNGAKWTVRGATLVRNERVPGGASGQYVLRTKKLAEVSHILWPSPPKQLEDAITAYQRGDAQTALRLVQDVLNFFEKMRKDAPGSFWLKAASVKLDALMVLQNDTMLTAFIRELEAVDSSAVPGLPDRVKLAKLARTGRLDSKAAVAEADTLIRQTTNTEILAQAHLIKGDALLALREPEKAMNAYLRVNVFYGNPPHFIPAAQLGAAKAFRAMNSPANRELKLEAVANAYLRDTIREYPLTKEAAIAKTMLPKDEREAAIAATEEQEKNIEAATRQKADPENTLPPAPSEKPAPQGEAVPPESAPIAGENETSAADSSEAATPPAPKTPSKKK
jgi:hypothetical protein